MKIEPMSEEMNWILCKFLKESLEFLSSKEALGVRRGDWIDAWMFKNLKEPYITNFLTAMMEIDKNE